MWKRVIKCSKVNYLHSLSPAFCRSVKKSSYLASLSPNHILVEQNDNQEGLYSLPHHLLSFYILCCLFVSNKRQNVWTDRTQLLVGAVHDPREGFWMIIIKILKNSQQNSIWNPLLQMILKTIPKVCKRNFKWHSLQIWHCPIYNGKLKSLVCSSLNYISKLMFH